MVKFKSGFVCAAFLGFFALTGTASAMPVGQLGSDVNAAAPQTDVQKVRWVCGPYGNCVWRPNYLRARIRITATAIIRARAITAITVTARAGAVGSAPQEWPGNQPGHFSFGSLQRCRSVRSRPA